MVCSVLLDTGPRKASKQLSYQVILGKQTQSKKKKKSPPTKYQKNICFRKDLHVNPKF